MEANQSLTNNLDLDTIFQKFLPSNELKFVKYLVYGTTENNLSIPSTIRTNEDTEDTSLGIEVKVFSLVNRTNFGNIEDRVTRIGLFQNSIVQSTTESVQVQKDSLIKLGLHALKIAYQYGTNIFCFQELWTMPLGFVTRDKLPWTEFAEDPILGSTTLLLQKRAKEYGMIIISPILERDKHDLLWNSAVIIDGTKNTVEVSRKSHIPIAGGENCYFQHSDEPVKVYHTKYGRIGVSICFDRHHPQNWFCHRLNGAQIVFNPSASVQSFSEHLWPIEGRMAAVSNKYFVASINRVGMEKFTSQSGSNETIRKYYGSTFVTSPLGHRTPGLSTHQNGVLIVDVDLQECDLYPNGNANETHGYLSYVRQKFMTS